MASQLLRTAARAGARVPTMAATRGFQTSAVLRQDAVVAPVRKPVLPSPVAKLQDACWSIQTLLHAPCSFLPRRHDTERHLDNI
jgi:hypothetical protein